MSYTQSADPNFNPLNTNAASNQLQVETDIEKRIKSDVYQKNIRVREFFFDYDKLRKGTVTDDKFRTALSMLNIYMTKDDVEELVRRYSIGNGLVKYDDFCKNIDAQFFDYDYARENLLQTKSTAVYSDDESRVLFNALRLVKHIIKTKRILLKLPFQDFDRTNCSHVTREQFGRVLVNVGIQLDQPTIDILARKYMDKGNTREVNYVQFCKEVDDFTEITSSPEKKNQVSATYIPNDVINDVRNLDLASNLYLSKKLGTGSDSLEVEKKIQAEVVMKKLRIKEFFKDFDNLRKGTVSESQFRRILDMTTIALNDQEFNSLLEKYKQPNGLVNYKDFVDNIDRVFTTPGIEKDPLYQVSGVDYNTTLAARRKFLELSPEEEYHLQQLVDIYRQQIKNRRVLLKPTFQDFDKTQLGYVSKNQFLRILNQFDLFPNNEALNLLLKRYTDRGNLDEVNYYDFCRDVDLYDDEGKEISKKHAESFKGPMNQSLRGTAFISNENPQDLNDLLARLRRKAKQNRIRISEFLRDFDKLRSGAITNTQLRLGFNMAGLTLSDQEFNLLVNNFASETKSGYVRWKDICDTVDEVFTTKYLEKDPTFDISEPNLQYNYGIEPLTGDEIEVAKSVINRFKQFARGTRLDIKQFFKDWDRLNRNKVSPKQFRQVLATVNFLLSEPEFKAIVKYYRSEEDGEIKYVDFINETTPNPLEATGSPLKAATQTSPVKSGTDFYPSGSPVRTQGGSVDIGLLLEKIKNQVKLGQLRVEDYFKDFDPLRKGIITSNKFRGVLSKMKIELTEEELRALEGFYRLAGSSTEYPYQINYVAFIDEVSIVFTTTGLEKDPLLKPQQYKPPSYLDPKEILTPQEEYELHEEMTRFGANVFKHRVLIKPYFQDKDKTKSGKISFTRFRSVLDVLKLPISDRFYNLLCKRFAHEGKEFNYVEFMDVLKKYSDFE